MFGARSFLYADSMYALASITKKLRTKGSEQKAVKLMRDAIAILEDSGAMHVGKMCCPRTGSDALPCCPYTASALSCCIPCPHCQITHLVPPSAPPSPPLHTFRRERAQTHTTTGPSRPPSHTHCREWALSSSED